MALKVKIAYKPDAFTTHPLEACLVDDRDGAQVSSSGCFRDMGQVRSYYNGWLDALSSVGYALGEGYINLHVKNSWVNMKRLFVVPASFDYTLPTDYVEMITHYINHGWNDNEIMDMAKVASLEDIHYVRNLAR